MRSLGCDRNKAGNTVKMEYKWLRLWAYSECSGGCSFKTKTTNTNKKGKKKVWVESIMKM